MTRHVSTVVFVLLQGEPVLVRLAIGCRHHHYDFQLNSYHPLNVVSLWSENKFALKLSQL